MLKSYCQCLRVWLFRDRAFNEVLRSEEVVWMGSNPGCIVRTKGRLGHDRLAEAH